MKLFDNKHGLNRCAFVLLYLLAMMWAIGVIAQPGAEAYRYDLSYFMPSGVYSYDPKVPTPQEVLGFQLGEQHVGWDQVVSYMKTLEASSDRVSVRESGRTYQHRPFIEVVITSGENQKRIGQL